MAVSATQTATGDYTSGEDLESADLAPTLILIKDEGRLAVGQSRYSAAESFGKRALDVTVSSLLLLLLAPVLAAIAIAIRLDSKGPALFRQSRVGLNERPFTILKFRTMTTGNDNSAHREFVVSMLRNDLTNEDETGDQTFKLVDDPRITRLGGLLRRTSLDELPQLINVFKGEMTLVGPRPSLFYELEEYESRHRLRALSQPGMTGLWQVEGRSLLHMRDALELDAKYVESCSLKGDLKILARTPSALLTSRSAH